MNDYRVMIECTGWGGLGEGGACIGRVCIVYMTRRKINIPYWDISFRGSPDDLINPWMSLVIWIRRLGSSITRKLVVQKFSWALMMAVFFLGRFEPLVLVLFELWLIVL